MKSITHGSDRIFIRMLSILLVTAIVGTIMVGCKSAGTANSSMVTDSNLNSEIVDFSMTDSLTRSEEMPVDSSSVEIDPDSSKTTSSYPESTSAAISSMENPVEIAGQVLFDGKKSITWSSSKEKSFVLSTKDASSFNYFEIYYSSDIPLKCILVYTDKGAEKQETFFLEAGKSQKFTSYIDAFNPVQTGPVKSLKILGKTSSDTSAESISRFVVSTKPVLEKITYVSNNMIKIGAKLDWGGGLCYYENLVDKVELYEKAGKKFIKANGNKLDGGNLVTGTVNLLNSNDTGRLLQQSYYGTMSAPYQPAMYMNTNWSFNPVQGGDQYNNKSKIIDVRKTNNSIYVKCQPMDWAQKNMLTETYMEATYTLDGNLMYVDNRFTDFTGYTHPSLNQEMPALYVGEPLRIYAYYGGAYPFTGATDIKKRDDLFFWADNYTAHTFHTTENWSAWITEDDWGLGIYVPGVKSMLSGRHQRDTIYTELPESASPVNYTAALKPLRLKSFTPLVYKYMIITGTLEQIRAGIVQNKDKINNTNLTSYGK